MVGFAVSKPTSEGRRSEGSMDKKFLGDEIVKLLASGQLRKTALENEPIVLSGLVKVSDDDKGTLHFCLAGCSDWVAIPVSLVEHGKYLKTVPCKDHHHDFMELHLKPSSDPNVQAVTGLLRHYAKALTKLTDDTYKMCFYERNGQYAGSQIYYSFDSAAKACSNWQQFHGGSCLSVDPGDACPTTP
jgi:hypothetical protein